MIDQIQIAKPCPANWDEMTGDDAVRHCSLCRMDVHNLSEMTEVEIETLFAASGRACGRLYRRQDGTVITKDCPRGVRAFRARAVRHLALAASFVFTALGCGEKGEDMKRAMGVDVVEKVFTKEEPRVIYGNMALPITSTPIVTERVKAEKAEETVLSK